MAKVNLLNRERITVSPQRITRLRLGDTEFSLPNRITRVRLGDTGFSLLKCITNFVTEEYHQMIHVTLNFITNMGHQKDSGATCCLSNFVGDSFNGLTSFAVEMYHQPGVPDF